MENCTESHQAEINKKIRANDKLRKILTNMPDEHKSLIYGDSLKAKMQSLDDEKVALLAAKRQFLPLQSRIVKQKNYLERTSREIETKQQHRLEILQKWIEADQELDAAHAKQVQAKHEMSILVAEQTAENAKAVNQGTSFIQSLSSPSNPDSTHNRPSSQCSNLFSRCKTWGATALLNSSWPLGRQMRKSRKLARSWHKQCGNWKVGVILQNQGSKRPNLRVKWWYWTQSSLHAYLDTAAWISKAKKPSRGVCRTQPQKRDVWRRNASKKRMSYSLICLWFWIRFIAVPFYLTLSRVGEAENPSPVCATAKLFGANYDAIGLWAQNLSNRSEVELEPLFAQVGECRKMFSERFGKDSKLYTSSVSQDIHNAHSHLDRSSLPVPTERNDGLAHTQQCCDYLSLFQEGEQGGSGHHVLSNLHFRGMEGKERSNPFCHLATRGGRKHTGKRRKLELSKGVVNIIQCNVTTWSEHARHYILTSDFDAALISETLLGKERLLSAVTEAKKSGWLARAAQQQTLSITARVHACSHWFENVGFPSPCQSSLSKLTTGREGHTRHGQGDFVAHSVFRALSRFSQ